MKFQVTVDGVGFEIEQKSKFGEDAATTEALESSIHYLMLQGQIEPLQTDEGKVFINWGLAKTVAVSAIKP